VRSFTYMRAESFHVKDAMGVRRGS